MDKVEILKAKDDIVLLFEKGYKISMILQALINMLEVDKHELKEEIGRLREKIREK